MLKKIQVLEDGSVPAEETRNWRIEGQKRRITRKEYQRLLNTFEMEGFMAQKGLRNLAREKILRERRALPKEEAIREYKTVNNISHGKNVEVSKRTKKKGAKRGKEKGRKRRT